MEGKTEEVVSSACAELAGRWLLGSGIQREDGGVARYYRADEGRNEPVSNEITGYTASLYSWLTVVSGAPEYRQGAVRTARFLCRTAWQNELATFPFEIPSNGLWPPAYFFDCGIIIRGLLAVWRLTRDGEYLAAAARAGETMAADFWGEGTIHPRLSLPSKEPLPYEPRWSRSPGCYQLKAAMAWWDLSAATGDWRFQGHYERAFEMAVASHESFLPGAEQEQQIMDRLHAYCYFLEGLLPVASGVEAAAALRDGIKRTSRMLREIGPNFERCDVCAQLLRLRIFCDALGIVRLEEREAEQEVRALEAYQSAESDRRLNGGFYFGRRAGRLLPFVNPVSTAFAAQGLTLWRQHQAGRFEPRVEDLI